MKKNGFEEEQKLFDNAQKHIEDSYKKMDEEFEKWKEGVLIFEHSEYSVVDNSVDDNWVHNGEHLWPSEDEDGCLEINGADGQFCQDYTEDEN